MTTDKRKDVLAAKGIADKFLGSILDRKKGDHLFPWRPFAAKSYRDTRIQPYLPRYVGYEVRRARTTEEKRGKPSVVMVEVGLQSGKRYTVIGELTVIREEGEWGVIPYRWKVLSIERSE